MNHISHSPGVSKIDLVMAHLMKSTAIFTISLTACVAEPVIPAGQVVLACGPTDGAAFEVVLSQEGKEIILYAENQPERKDQELRIGIGETSGRQCSPGRKNCSRIDKGRFTISGSRNEGFEGRVSIILADGEAVRGTFRATWDEPNEPVFCG